MRGRLCLAGFGLLLGGCAQPDEQIAVPAPVPVLVDAPAGSAGGACRLLDFALVEEATGVRFDVAAASEQGDTHSCVIRAEQQAVPDLTLSVSETSIDLAAFKADLMPKGARAVPGLGRAAYRLTVAPASKQGPVAEVAWLAEDGRLASLRYTLPVGQVRADAEGFTPKLVTLAKQVDTRAL
ncbi:hypothetical protein GSF22_21460 [Micromonospora echinofusca]|uniref:Uncharacterized protein n=1 Tax=Micromonospora echinofusca TaxID=47858 RepID=A0ABS3VVI8_MICEH|nr:hypothetical protein [Micromonospora echinofusca]